MPHDDEDAALRAWLEKLLGYGLAFAAIGFAVAAITGVIVL